MNETGVTIWTVGALAGLVAATSCVRGVKSWVYRIGGWVTAFLACILGSMFVALGVGAEPIPYEWRSMLLSVFIGVMCWGPVLYFIWLRAQPRATRTWREQFS
ncbi:hypothetical protein CCO03_04480 [Comamonas serinivorans]|uniref:Uncharacterized protein n=1 Tax=Comamonas serinivorans TaxID=1082851 RepID=A0A1Y0EKY0_9BURK|nr:hypothetical protein [Comamonas serinivorans]ARU04029.1 hypothetical protein CCO03_04480 [Comamonas serinivorans]